MSIRTVAMTLLLILSTDFAHANLMELAISGSYRNTNLADDNYEISSSITASYSYYFMEMSALEFSYTSGGVRKRSKSLSDPSANWYESLTEFEMMGIDVVFAFANRKAAVQPFIKVGAAEVTKTFYDVQEAFGTKNKIISISGTTPSAGVGCRIRLSTTFSLKLNYDYWATPTGSDSKSDDYAARAGISWYF